MFRARAHATGPAKPSLQIQRMQAVQCSAGCSGRAGHREDCSLHRHRTGRAHTCSTAKMHAGRFASCSSNALQWASCQCKNQRPAFVPYIYLIYKSFFCFPGISLWAEFYGKVLPVCSFVHRGDHVLCVLMLTTQTAGCQPRRRSHRSPCPSHTAAAALCFALMLQRLKCLLLPAGPRGCAGGPRRTHRRAPAHTRGKGTHGAGGAHAGGAPRSIHQPRTAMS